MSEHEFKPRPVQDGLLSVVDDLEQGIEALTASLDNLRATVRVIAEQVRSIEQPAAAVPVLTVVEPNAETIEEPEPVISDVTEGVFSWAPARIIETPEIAPHAALEAPAIEPAVEAPVTAFEPPLPSAAERDEVRRAVEAARAELAEPPAVPEIDREEVRRTVEATRAEMSWSNLRVDSGFSVAPTESLDEPSPSEAGAPPQPSATVPAVDEEAARREDVRLAVERAHADMNAANNEPPATDAEEARREEVRLAVERARLEMMGQAEAPPVSDEEARREEVRLAVERARVEMMGKTEAPAIDEDEARREEVRRMVENTRGALSWSDMKSDSGSWGQFKPEPTGFSIGPDQAPPHSLDDAAPDGGPRIVPVLPKPGAPLPKGADFSGPPIIVIEDPSGRVELSQVFATLSKVDQSAQAALLNYSPHSVTIGLSMAAPVPDPNQLLMAAQAVFGRSCSVKSEGNRTAIEVGTHPVG